jgi:opacity protein-like surface antigen
VGQTKRTDRRWGGMIAAALFLAAALAPAAGRAGGKGVIEIGLTSHYNWGAGDAQDFDPSLSYGLIFHYWLNDTTSIMAGFDQLHFNIPFEVNGNAKDYAYNASLIYGGLRYRPKLDFFLTPYLEVGLGYQTWNITDVSSPLKTRGGGSAVYEAATGIEYDVLHSVTVSLNLRYYDLMMNERLATQATTRPSGKTKAEYRPLENVGVTAAGIELCWRFR